MSLVLTPNIPNPDGFYDALLGEHESLNTAESAAYNARLILILANQIGDDTALKAALEAARLKRSVSG